MYLTDILIENVGPIENLDVRLPFHEDGRPKPVVLVGKNGSGKTVTQAIIADALVLMASQAFYDVTPQTPAGKAYFKIVGGSNQRVGTPYGISFLRFIHEQASALYIDKSGTLDPSTYTDKLMTRLNQSTSWATEGNHKDISGFTEEVVENIFKSSSLCFFPASRRELPHWINRDVLPDELSDKRSFSGYLGKPIFVEQSLDINKRWITDVVLDSRVELIRNEEGNIFVPAYDDANIRLFLTTARQNIDRLLQTVVEMPDVRANVTYRINRDRINVARGADIVIPSLDHLSLGQTVLFNLFCTIVRYADMHDLNRGNRLEDIEGIVIVDEIDAHLHSNIQYQVLPSLIKLFPKVQFIISSHAPIFLMGMEHEFGSDGFALLEMPTGQQISTERFSEFERSLEYYRQTLRFEHEIEERILSHQKPCILTEGETDRDYILAALEVLGRDDLLNQVVVDWVGASAGGSARDGGKDALNATAKVFKANPDLLQRRLLLLYDCDTNKPSENIDNTLFIKVIPQNVGNTTFSRGIENLLPAELAKEQFYDVTEQPDPYGGSAQIRKLNKRRLCDWVCQQRNPAHFAQFSVIMDIVEEFLSSQPEVNS